MPELVSERGRSVAGFRVVRVPEGVTESADQSKSQKGEKEKEKEFRAKKSPKTSNHNNGSYHKGNTRRDILGAKVS